MAKFPIPIVGKLTNSDYIKNMNTAAIIHPGSMQHWWIKTVSVGDFVGAGATSQSVNLNALFPHDPFPEHVMQSAGSFLRLLQLFAGGAVSAASVELGYSGATDVLVDTTNVFTGQDLGVKQTPTADEYIGEYRADLDPLLTIATSSANISALTTGSVQIFIPYFPAPHFG